MNIFYTIMRALVWPFAKIIYPVKVFNKKALPKERRVVVISNHLAWQDAVLVSINIPKYRHFLGKKELGKNPITRFFAFLVGAILIDRHQADMNAMRKCVNALKKNHGLMIFPEGTRNKIDDSIQDIKHGVAMFALKGDAQIVPIMIDKKAKAFKRTYLYVGEPFKLEGSGEKMITSEAMSLGAELVGQKMKEAQNILKELVTAHLEKKGKRNESNNS